MQFLTTIAQKFQENNMKHHKLMMKMECAQSIDLNHIFAYCKSLTILLTTTFKTTFYFSNFFFSQKARQESSPVSNHFFTNQSKISDLCEKMFKTEVKQPNFSQTKTSFR